MSCGDQNKDISGSKNISIYPAENAVLSFDRMLEFKTDSNVAKSMKSELTKLGVLDNQYYPGIKIKKQDTSNFLNFIQKNKNELFLDPKHQFTSYPVDSGSVLYYLKNNKNKIELSKEIKSVKFINNHSDLEIQLTNKGVFLLKQFVMTNITKTLLVESDNNLIIAANALGDFKNGTLTLPIHNN